MLILSSLCIEYLTAWCKYYCLASQHQNLDGGGEGWHVGHDIRVVRIAQQTFRKLVEGPEDSMPRTTNRKIRIVPSGKGRVGEKIPRDGS